MNPLGATLSLLFCLGVLFLPRKAAALTVVAAVCYITQGQEVPVLGFHFTSIRFVLLAGIVRVVARRELAGITVNKIDWALIAYTCLVSAVATYREGKVEELIYRFGFAYNILLSYFVFRALLRDLAEMKSFLVALAFLILPLAAEMTFELIARRSLFEPFGAIGDLTIREGRPRCQGAFRIGITAGVFGATLIPFFVGLFWANINRPAAIIGLFSALVIVYTSNSSGPLMAFLSAIIALLFWRIRTDMRKVRRAIVMVLLLLQLCMKAPVWYLFARMSDLTGGDGWHRSYLISQALEHLNRWWLLGTSFTGDWMATMLTDGKADITNQYLNAGVDAGLGGMVLFILLLIRCYRYLGVSMVAARLNSTEAEILLWCFGCVLFAHTITMFSVSYFDQLHVVWWGFLAMISSATGDAVKEAVANGPVMDSAALVST